MQINLTPDYSLLVIMAIFIVNYFVVSRFFLRPINRILEDREHETRIANEAYEQSMARFNEATSKMQEQLHVAKREASSVRERFRGEASAHRTTVVDRTNAEAKKLVSEAETRLSSDVAAAREKIARDSETLARLAAEKLLGRTL